MTNTAIVLGAGSGSRMKSDKSKMLLELMGKTVIERSVEAFLDIPQVDEIIVTAREEDIDEYVRLLDYDKVTFVIGGKTRQDSVKNAVETIDDDGLVIIHDGARPFIRRQDIINSIKAAKECGAAAVGVPVKDTIKVLDSDGFIIDTPDRARLYAVQTPQVFDIGLYKKALEKAYADARDYTDDCQLLEADGVKVKMVTGDYSNIKITTPDDIAVGENIILQSLRRG